MRRSVVVVAQRAGQAMLLCLAACTGRPADRPEAGPGVLHGDAAVTHCPLHQDQLQDDRVPRVPGGIMDVIPPGLGDSTGDGSWQLEYEWQAEPREFPFAHSQFSSGCSWDPRMANERVR